jgi:uncharacterized membrane protein YedE/YeeE
MSSYIGAIVMGLICIVLGILNMRGNISSLHSYHRKRVSEEDRLPFGKRIGLGTFICGVSIAIFGVLEAVSEKTENQGFALVGAVLLVAGLIIGLGMSLWAMIKYNKGIF